MIENQKKYAIVAVDTIQDYFTDPQMQEKRKSLTDNINQLCVTARENDVPVIWARQEFRSDMSDAYTGLRTSQTKLTVENTPGSQLLPELVVGENDTDLVKKRFSAFFKTELNDILAEKSVTSLIVLGVKTHACIRATAIDSYQNDYETIIAGDCIGDTDAEHADTSLKYLSKYIAVVLSNPEILKLLTREK